MNRNAYFFCLFVLALAGLGGCSSEPPAKESKKAGTATDRIQGKAQVLAASTATDAALNAVDIPCTFGKACVATACS